MAFLTIIGFRIGFSIAKALGKVLLQDHDFLAELVPDLMGQAGEGAEARLDRDAESKLATIGEQIARRMQPLFEASSLDQSQRQAVVREVALALAAARINADLLVRCRLDPAQLAQHLQASRPDAKRTLSAVEGAVYSRMLDEAAREITAVAAELAGFAGSLAAAQLQTQDQVLEYLANLFAQPEQADAAFENIYRDTVGRVLDRMEVFGIRRMEQTTGRQRLSVAYITLEAVNQAKQEPNEI